MALKNVEIPLVYIEIRRAYSTIEIPDDLSDQEQKDFALAAYKADGGDWESEYVIDIDTHYLGDSIFKFSHRHHEIEITDEI